MCNRLQLINQTSETFARCGIPHGIIQGPNTTNPFAQVVICSIQTVAKRGLPEDIKLVIIDECHGASGTKAYHDVMKGRYVVGLTATPYQDGLGRNLPGLGGALFESIVCGAHMRDLIADGYLVDADFWAPAEPDLTGVSTVKTQYGLDYKEDDIAKVMDKSPLIGDIVTHWFKHAHGKQTMVFAVNIAHSQHICQQFISSGVKAIHVDYRMSDDDKAAAYKAPLLSV
jgi:superfamily II DNA or RNA helicase